MPDSFPGSLVYYPHYCFQYSATYNTWVRLTAAVVHALEARRGFEGMIWIRRMMSHIILTEVQNNNLKGQNTYFHLNHPIRWIRLVGVIVAFDAYPNRVQMTLDDSSGLTIEIFCRKETSTAPVTDTTVDRHGAIKLHDLCQQETNGHVCTTNEGYKVNLQGIDVGSVVKVKGGISEFRGGKQLTLERICMFTQYHLANCCMLTLAS